MPRSSSEKLDSSDRVHVKVTGATLNELKEAAVAVAAEFFGVEADSHHLEPGALAARPHITAVTGQVVTYVAETWIYYKPVQEDDEGEETEPVGPPARTGPVTVPQRRNPAPRQRDRFDEDNEWDDDIDDEAEDDEDGDEL